MSLCIVCFVVSTPVFRNGAGRQVYMFIALSGWVSLVVSCMCSYVDRLLLLLLLLLLVVDVIVVVFVIVVSGGVNYYKRH